VFEIANGTWVLKWSDQSKSRNPFSMDWYVLGSQSGPKGNETLLAALSTGFSERSAFVASMQPMQQCAFFLSCSPATCITAQHLPRFSVLLACKSLYIHVPFGLPCAERSILAAYMRARASGRRMGDA
jgi:hypothetical protein